MCVCARAVCVHTFLIQIHISLPGLQDLTLSANPGVTVDGWVQLFISIAAGSCLKTLYLDYNHIGDTGAACLGVVLCGKGQLSVIDLETTNITNEGAKVGLSESGKL